MVDLLELDADAAGEPARARTKTAPITIHAFVTPGEGALYESLGFRSRPPVDDPFDAEAAKANARHYSQPSRPRWMPPRRFRVGPAGLPSRRRYQDATRGLFRGLRGQVPVRRGERCAGHPPDGPTLAVAGGGWRRHGAATTLSKFTDSGQYMYHNSMIRIGGPGEATPMPATVRIASSTGETIEAPVDVWLGGGLPRPPALPQGADALLRPGGGQGEDQCPGGQFPDVAESLICPTTRTAISGPRWP